MPCDKRWDLDLDFGKQGEQWLSLLADLPPKRTMEVKRDRDWVKYGNLFFEYECNGKPSGVAATEADYFAVIMYRDGKNIATHIWETQTLKAGLRKLIRDGKAIHKGNSGDGGRVKGYAVPLRYLHELVF